jgi:DNA transposition AAA+ family ATPase
MKHHIDKTLLNISEIARRVKISQPYASQIINGQKTGPKAQQRLKEIEAEIMRYKKQAA